MPYWLAVLWGYCALPLWVNSGLMAGVYFGSMVIPLSWWLFALLGLRMSLGEGEGKQLIYLVGFSVLYGGEVVATFRLNYVT